MFAVDFCEVASYIFLLEAFILIPTRGRCAHTKATKDADVNAFLGMTMLITGIACGNLTKPF